MSVTFPAKEFATDPVPTLGNARHCHRVINGGISMDHEIRRNDTNSDIGPEHRTPGSAPGMIDTSVVEGIEA